MAKKRQIRRLKSGKKVLEIITEPDSILRAPSDIIRPVGDFKAPGLKELIVNMIHTIHAVNGIGLAAPQVGWPLRLAVAIIDRQPFVMFNPEVVEHDDKQISIEEGCLSCPGVKKRINRWNDIIVEFNNISGVRTQVRAAGVDAIILQHEIDHLNGKLIIDYE